MHAAASALTPSTTEPQPPVAVILSHLHGPVVESPECLVSVGVDGAVRTAAWHPAADSTAERGHIIDAFLDLWHDHHHTGLILYVSDTTVRRLLQEQIATFPGLIIRGVIAGQRLQATWAACRAAHHQQEVIREPQPEVKEPLDLLVVATDASKQNAKKTTGIGAVTSEGRVRMSVVEADSVVAGEFAAVLMALDTWGERAGRMEILTDSQLVCRQLHGRPEHRRGGRFEDRCREKLRDLASVGIEVQVSWVRGHNGHLLNTYADRAAVAARRCAQFRLDNRADFAARLRGELGEALIDAPVAALLPQPAAVSAGTR